MSLPQAGRPRPMGHSSTPARAHLIPAAAVLSEDECGTSDSAPYAQNKTLWGQAKATMQTRVGRALSLLSEYRGTRAAQRDVLEATGRARGRAPPCLGVLSLAGQASQEK